MQTGSNYFADRRRYLKNGRLWQTMLAIIQPSISLEPIILLEPSVRRWYDDAWWQYHSGVSDCLGLETWLKNTTLMKLMLKSLCKWWSCSWQMEYESQSWDEARMRYNDKHAFLLSKHVIVFLFGDNVKINPPIVSLFLYFFLQLAS
jgi:hypothetical protein